MLLPVHKQAKNSDAADENSKINTIWNLDTNHETSNTESKLCTSRGFHNTSTSHFGKLTAPTQNML